MIWLLGICLTALAALYFYFRKSRSMPPQRKPAEETVERTTNVFNDPKSTNLDDCTNPFRVQNNVRIRDIVMQHGEADDGGRRGMAVVEVASKFRKDFRLPLGGVPNMPEERLIQKMQAVETVEWVVEKMGDGNYYVIVPVETIKRAKEVGPGSRSDAPAIPAEKPKSTGISPAAKRMFGFALKSAMSNNTRMEGTRERVLKERIYATEMYDGEIVCDSDGDPVMTHIPVQKENKIEHEISQSFDREHIMALDNKAALSRDIEWKAGKMRILRSQPITNPCRPSPSSSNSSVIGNRGNTSKPVAGSSRPSPPNPSSSMFGGPSFGTFRGAPHPDSLAPVEKDDDSSEIIQPTQSSLASKLPQSTFASTLKESEDSGYSELPETPEKHRPMECDFRREMRQRLGIASDGFHEMDDAVVEEEDYDEVDDVIIEEEKLENTKEYSPHIYPPGLAPLSAPPGIPTRPSFPMYPMVMHPLPPSGIWLPVPMTFMPPPPFYPPPFPPIGFFPPPGILLPPPHLSSSPRVLLPPGLPPPARIMTGPPPGLWSAPPLAPHPPGIPPPNKEHPVVFKGEVYYDTPPVWPPPIRKERTAERREKTILPIRAPDNQSASAFSSAVGTAAGAALTPMFGTRNQSVPSPVTASRPAASAFGVSAPAPTSAFGGIRVSPPSSVSVPPRKLVEVIESDSEKEKSKPKGAELLGATIQLIGELRGGAVVYIHQIEGKPVEDVVAGNCDFFDIDEDERIHLLHNVDPLLLTYEGIPIGEIIEDEKKKEVVEEKKKEEDPPKEVKLTAFSRPAPPSFGGVSSRAVPLFGLSRPTETTSAFATKPREVPTFGRPVKIVDDEPNERSASGLSIGVSSRVIPPFGGTINQKVEEVKESNERPASSQSVGVSSRVVPSFGGMASQKVEEVKERAPSVMSTASTLESPKPQPGMPSFGTKSLHVPERPDSALSNRSEDPPRKVSNVSTSGGLPRQEERAEEFVVATFGGSEPVERPHSALSDSSSGSDITVESTQGSKYRTAESDFSGRNTESMVSHSSIHSSKDELDRDEKEDEELAEERVENSSGPYAFPNHPDIRRLSRKASVAFDSVKRGHLYMGSILTSIEPNRLVMTLREGDMMQKVQMIMRELGAAYGEQPPLGAANVRLGQFAVAINGQVIVRVVVLRYLKESDEFLCACLDIHALIEVAAQNLYELYDRFGVHALRASTFIARINGLPNLGEKGHKAVSMIVKGEEDDSFKKPSPFVFHGKDDVTDDILVDVAVLIAGTPMWMGESLGPFIGVTCYNLENVVNPGIQHAIKFAIEHELEGYELPEKIEKKEADVESESYTPNEADLNTIRCDSVENVQELVASMQVTPKEEEEEKEEGELDSSHDDSTASERTTVDRHAAGDFVGDVKGKQMDEFVVVAPAPVKAIIDVESMTALIRLFNKKGEHVSADVIKAMCRALVLSANNTLSTLGERGSLIANAEALEAIDMA